MSKQHSIQRLTALTLVYLGAAGCNDSDAPPPTTNDNEAPASGMTGMASLSDVERQILQTVHEKNLEEIAVGRMAIERGSSEAVRAHGDRLVDDHTRNESDLTALTKELGVVLTEPAKQSPAIQALEPLRGVEFDARFGTLMHEGHSSLIEKVEIADSQVRDGQVKSFLAKTLPALKQHLRLAQEQNSPGVHGGGDGSHELQDPTGGH